MADRHQLILELIPRLRRFARAVSGDIGLGDDAVKSAIVDALRQRFGSQDQERLFRSLLSAIYGDFKMQDAIGAVRPVAANSAVDASNVADRLRALPLAERAALVLATTEALSYRSIAEIMGVDEMALRGHLAQAREKLGVGSIDQPDLPADGVGYVRAASP